jgi:hypothetical protein
LGQKLQAELSRVSESKRNESVLPNTQNDLLDSGQSGLPLHRFDKTHNNLHLRQKFFLHVLSSPLTQVYPPRGNADQKDLRVLFGFDSDIERNVAHQA